MTLYQKLAQIESKVAGIEVKLGIPQRKNLLCRKIANNHISKTSTITDILINPKPFITNVRPQLVNLQVASEGVDNVFISSSDYEVEIPRTYAETEFLGSVFMIDPPLNNGAIAYLNPTAKTVDGNWLKLIYLNDRDPTLWLLVLRQEADKRQ